MREIDIKIGEDHALVLGKLWMPEKMPRAVLQISHGMTEHIGRYKKLAEVLTAQGIFL